MNSTLGYVVPLSMFLQIMETIIFIHIIVRNNRERGIAWKIWTTNKNNFSLSSTWVEITWTLTGLGSRKILCCPSLSNFLDKKLFFVWLLNWSKIHCPRHDCCRDSHESKGCCKIDWDEKKWNNTQTTFTAQNIGYHVKSMCFRKKTLPCQ